MAKFKVGDKVRVNGVTDHRKEYNGKIFTIRSINPNKEFNDREHYGVDGNCPYIFYLEELNPAEFTKANLENGMVVEYGMSKRALAIGDRFIAYDGWMPLSSYDDELNNISGSGIAKQYDVVKVYKVKDSCCCILDNLFVSHFLELIWEREEEKKEPDHKEMTVEEIEKALGYKVKIVGENE